jgi:hypothetical protein
MAIKGAGNAIANYNAADISQYVNNVDLTNAIAELEATVLTSTAEQSVPGLGSYTVKLEGDWIKALDLILGPDSISGTIRTFFATFGSGANTVTYTWTTNAFITNYEIKTAAKDKITFSAQLRLNNAPTRT